jgi:hypothetical protein
VQWGEDCCPLCFFFLSSASSLWDDIHPKAEMTKYGVVRCLQAHPFDNLIPCSNINSKEQTNRADPCVYMVMKKGGDSVLAHPLALDGLLETGRLGRGSQRL